MLIQKSRKFLAILDVANLFGEVLQNQARIVGRTKERAIDGLRATLDEGSRSPNKSYTKNGAERHAELRIGGEDRGKESREQKNGEEGAKEQKNGEAALDENIARAAAEKRGNFQDAMLDDRVGKRQRIQDERKDKERTEPKGQLVAGEIPNEAMDDRGENTQNGAPENYAAFAAGFAGTLLAQRIPEQGQKSENKE